MQALRSNFKHGEKRRNGDGGAKRSHDSNSGLVWICWGGRSALGLCLSRRRAALLGISGNGCYSRSVENGLSEEPVMVIGRVFLSVFLSIFLAVTAVLHDGEGKTCSPSFRAHFNSPHFLAITCLSSCSLEIRASANHAFCCGSLMTRTLSRTFPPLALTSKFAPLSSTERLSSSRFGTRLGRSASVRSHRHTTVVHTELLLFTM